LLGWEKISVPEMCVF